jgi:PEGA domain-containing protein
VHYDTDVGPEKTNPLVELQALDGQIERTGDLAGLKPIFARLDELARQHPADFEVQLAVSESKQRVLARGALLKEAALKQTPPPSVVASAPPLPLPPQIRQQREAAPVIQAPRVPPPQVSPPPVPPPEASPPRRSGTSAMVLGGIAGAILAIGALVFFVNQARRNNSGAGVAVQVATTPPGAAIRVNGEQKCAANCDLSLVPGDYQLMAFLDGYEPAVSLLTVVPGKPAAVNLQLQPQVQSVRILTDLPQGQVTLDDQPPVDLQDGQYVFTKIASGAHAIKVTSRTGEASFPIEIADAKAPTVSGPVAARNLIAVLVSSIGEKARVTTNSPAKLALNGQPQTDASPAGVDLMGFKPGVNEFAVGEGKDQRTLSESFGPAPALTVFLKSDLNIGTLIISTAEDEARVFLNGKEYPRKTQRGQVRIPTIGNITVRVTKEGFELALPQVADVKKGSEVRLEFKMQPLPRVATLELKNATPGAEVLVDQKPAGTVGPDGSFTGNGIAPGDHIIELRRENYVAKRMQRQFVAGRTVELAGADVVLAAAVGSVRVARTPADAAVVYRRADETQTHELRGNQAELPPGSYVFTGRAAGYTEKAERVAVTAGGTHTVELALARVVAAPPPPPPAPKIAGISDFEDSNAWNKQGELWTHKGGGFIPFKPAANGTFAFTVRLLRGGSLFRGGRIRWAMQYAGAKNYDLFEMDRRYLYSKVIIDGKTFDRGKYEHGLSDREMSYTLQLESSPDKLVHSIKIGDKWLVLDTWQEPGRNFTEGKFAFLVQGNDEIGLSDFKFTPR